MLRRRRMELSIKFRLRAGQTDGPVKKQLQIRLTVEGVTVSDYASGVKVRPDKWDYPTQLCRGRGKEFDNINERLAEIEQQHRDIWRELKRRYARGEGPLPTPDLLCAEWLTPGASDPKLTDFFGRYIAYITSLEDTGERAEKTRKRAELTGRHIARFLCDDQCTGLTVSGVTTAHGKRFHAWLQLNADNSRRMSRDSANKHLQHFRDCMEYAIDCGYTGKNQLLTFRPKRGKGKPVYFLEPVHFERLMDLPAWQENQYTHALWWVRLMCMTGLDYSDAVLYARSRAVYEQSTIAGTMIVMERSKPPRNVCEIPLLETVDVLFSFYPSGPPAPTLAEINDHLLSIEGAIGFDKRFSTKICRKTAGAHFLNLGYSIEAVSRMLGHSSVRTTEQHYLKITRSYMVTQMQRVKSAA